MLSGKGEAAQVKRKPKEREKGGLSPKNMIAIHAAILFAVFGVGK